jgi:hypothetical protein
MPAATTVMVHSFPTELIYSTIPPDAYLLVAVRRDKSRMAPPYTICLGIKPPVIESFEIPNSPQEKCLDRHP